MFPAGTFVVPRTLADIETGSQRSRESLSLLGVFLGTQAGRQNSSFHMKWGLQGPQGAGYFPQSPSGTGSALSHVYLPLSAEKGRSVLKRMLGVVWPGVGELRNSLDTVSLLSSPLQLLFLAGPQNSKADSFESESVEVALCGPVTLCWRQVTQWLWASPLGVIGSLPGPQVAYPPPSWCKHLTYNTLLLQVVRIVCLICRPLRQTLESGPTLNYKFASMPLYPRRA